MNEPLALYKVLDITTTLIASSGYMRIFIVHSFGKDFLVIVHAGNWQTSQPGMYIHVLKQHYIRIAQHLAIHKK